MRILMDADCLIKLTKSGLKEPICRTEKVIIPRGVKHEVVDAGRNKDYPDAGIVEVIPILVAVEKQNTIGAVTVRTLA